jgi:hypothetical protein
MKLLMPQREPRASPSPATHQPPPYLAGTWGIVAPSAPPPLPTSWPPPEREATPLAAPRSTAAPGPSEPSQPPTQPRGCHRRHSQKAAAPGRDQRLRLSHHCRRSCCRRCRRLPCCQLGRGRGRAAARAAWSQKPLPGSSGRLPPGPQLLATWWRQGGGPNGASPGKWLAAAWPGEPARGEKQQQGFMVQPVAWRQWHSRKLKS